MFVRDERALSMQDVKSGEHGMANMTSGEPIDLHRMQVDIQYQYLAPRPYFQALAHSACNIGRKE